MNASRGRRIGWTLRARIAALLAAMLIPLGVSVIVELRAGERTAAALVVAALLAAGLMTIMVLRRIRALVVATEALSRGDLTARVHRPADELGLLGRRFNSMAERLETQAAEIARARDELEERVQQRTDAALAVGRELRASDARKAAVMEASLDAIVLMDHAGVITDWNPAAEALFGWTSVEAIGRSLGELIIPTELRDQHQRGLQRYLETREPRVLGRRLEVTALRRDGGEFPAEVAVVRIRAEGQPAFTGYIRDVTERHQAAEATTLRAAKEAAEAANAELEAFSYSVAHDLRTPLRSIQGFSTVLLEDHGDAIGDDGRQSLRYVAGSALEMAGLIDALLALSRLTRTELQPRTHDLSQLGRAIVEQLRARHPERTVEVAIEDGLSVHGDARLLRSLLDNLLGNAWKFTAPTAGARIELGREPGDGEPTYFVRDNGAGFDMAHAAHLFMPFRRVHGRAEFEGTGIGLATAQRIIRRHGGRIWAEGAVGAGATFRFTLPAPARDPRR